MFPTALYLLLANLALLTLCVLALWTLCLRRRDPTPMDSFWAFGMILVAVFTFFWVGESSMRARVLVGLTLVWGFRLGFYMLWRTWHHGPDARYARMMEKAWEQRGWAYPTASLRLVFLKQIPFLWLVSLPLQLGQLTSTNDHLGPLGWIGAALALAGTLFESVGDYQLVRFKSIPGNAGRVMDRGLWRYTRHPNYFGDACTWWGIFLVAAETVPGRFAIAGPIFLTYTLLVWSGAALLERRMLRSRPEYADYIARTSRLLPWFPKRP